jgi:hypothetical protein
MGGGALFVETPSQPIPVPSPTAMDISAAPAHALARLAARGTKRKSAPAEGEEQSRAEGSAALSIRNHNAMFSSQKRQALGPFPCSPLISPMLRH